jgi:hypothetical protein
MTKEEITKEILKLKSNKVITQKDKLKIQLLQQELGRLDNENKN